VYQGHPDYDEIIRAEVLGDFPNSKTNSKAEHERMTVADGVIDSEKHGKGQGWKMLVMGELNQFRSI